MLCFAKEEEAGDEEEEAGDEDDDVDDAVDQDDSLYKPTKWKFNHTGYHHRHHLVWILAYYNSYLSNGFDPDNLYYYCWYKQEWCKVPDVAVCLYAYMLL